MNDLISRKALIAEYDRVHIGPPGGARKLIEDAPAVREWIPVSERLPEESGEYLAYCGQYDGICVLYYETLKTKRKWRTKWKEVTHWMPMPEAPKGE